MRTPLRTVAVILVLLFCCHLALAQTTPPAAKAPPPATQATPPAAQAPAPGGPARAGAAPTTYHQWWYDQFPGVGRGGRGGARSPAATKLPLISVKGNKFVDPEGKVILFRGLAISDPDKIANQGHWNKEHFQHVKDTGAMIVRIPVHPIAWRERGPAAYLTLLDQAVEWCTDLGMYIMIDWHSIGNLMTELFQNPMYVTSKTETFSFWRTIAQRYVGNNTIAFYEFFNEPSSYRGQLGPAPWEEWRKINEDWIALVRAYDKQKIPLVAGFDWAYDLTPLRESPIRAEGIGYVTHPYSNKRPQPWEPKWEEDFGFAAGQYPVVATEFSFGGAVTSDTDYGPRIIKYLEGKGISWLGWVYDPEWGPALLRSWDTYELTPPGRFFSRAMQGNPSPEPPAAK